MDSDKYKGLYPVQATFAPARAGYLIQAGSRTGFRRAVQEASTRWGGAAEPIFPIPDDANPAPWVNALLELTHIDGLVNVDLAESVAERTANALDLPWVPLKAIDRRGPVYINTHPLSLPSTSIDSLGSRITAAPTSRLWEAVAAGDLPADHLEEAQRQGVNVSTSGSADGVGRAQLRNATWIDQTVAAFGETYASPAPANIPTVVWITANDSLDDSLDFWNVRALRPRGIATMPMFLLPAEDVPYWLGFEAQLASALSRPDEISPDVFLTSSSASSEELASIAGALGLVPATDEETRTSVRFPPPVERRQAPFTYRIMAGVDQYVSFDRRYGVATLLDAHAFTGRSTILQFASPIAFAGGGATKVRLRSTLFDGLPKREAISSSMIPGAVWRGDELEIAVPALAQYRFEMKVPELRDALIALLDTAAESHAPSDKGSIASMFLAREDEAAALLEPDIFEAIRGLTTPRSRRFLDELERITGTSASSEDLSDFARDWASQSKRAYRLPGNVGLPAVKAGVALERLCGLGWAERGFELRCLSCRTPSFVPLASVPQTGAACPACRAAGDYTSANAGPSVFYRLDGLIDRASDQGVFPHLLTIAALQKKEPMSWFLPGVDFTFGGGDRREADIVGLYAGQLTVGEVKTRGAEFTAEQIERDINLAERLGADIYVLSAPDEISEETKSTARARSTDAGIELILLDRTELRP
ncbi:hypothetical protein SPF06_18870 [Sinomonas sp. JGH33]|uniref:REase associating with pPIWI RE domain-containing protein n=1 Tax=Sinomonas terricola TaxID=3110330 RepID=A0ABU5TBI1_9MICC|nr:hypothetical protein [Sinomonas sp. JGH33]MEA5456791.1 hypothetical protein [Sinomonas sp. JGH33]